MHAPGLDLNLGSEFLPPTTRAKSKPHVKTTDHVLFHYVNEMRKLSNYFSKQPQKMKKLKAEKKRFVKLIFKGNIRSCSKVSFTSLKLEQMMLCSSSVNDVKFDAILTPILKTCFADKNLSFQCPWKPKKLLLA